MKKIILLLALSASVSCCLFSCKKEKTVSTTTTIPAGPYTSMNDIFSALRLEPKVLTVDASIGGSFYGNSGTRYIFNANSFQNASGVTITGNIQIQVCEYIQKGDMIFSKMLPISNGEPLISGGEISIAATQNGLPVYLKRNNRFEAHIPTNGTPSTGMELFRGRMAEDTSTAITNWVLPELDSMAKLRIGVFTYPNQDTFNIISDSLILANADRFMTAPDYQNFTVTPIIEGDTMPSKNVFGYTIYDNFKGVWPLSSYMNKVFTENHVPNIPVHFAVFTLMNGNFYGGTLGTIPVSGSNYTVSLKKVDANTFKSQLNEM